MMIVQEKVPIQPDDTALSLLMKSAACGVSLLRQHIGSFLQKERMPHVPLSSGKLFLSSDISNEGFYDTNWSLAKGYAFLRAMDYRGFPIMPVPRIRLEDRIYEIENYALEKYASGGGRCLMFLRNRMEADSFAA